jgi:hypothetical protein
MREHAQHRRPGIVKRETGEVVIEEGAEAFGYGLGQLAQVESGDHGVVDIEQHSQTVALARPVSFGGPCPLEIDRLIDSLKLFDRSRKSD